MKALEDSVRAALVETTVAPGGVILVAISGGPDSTALLRALAALQEGWRLRLAACIVDHGIREEREIEEDICFARSLCDAHGVALTVARVPRGECVARAREEGRSREEMAREMRHRLLREAAGEAEARDIALGHTQDDLVETLLMRVLQGSDPDGLRGIPLRRGSFVRPLLRCTRVQVTEYLGSLGQGWREDSTNQDTGILRNRIRHVLLPVLQKDFHGFSTGLLALSRKLAHVSDFVRAQASLLPWVPDGKGFSIARDVFFSAPVAVRASSLLRLYDRFKGRDSPRRLPWRFLAPALVEKGIPGGRWILKGHGVGLSSRQDRLFWGPCIASLGKKGYFIVVSGVENIAIRGTGIRLQFARNALEEGVNDGGLSILVEEVDPPIVLRSKRKGDEILLDGGVTSVKEMLAGWKVPRYDRDRVPLLADRKGVLAVLGGALGYRTRARAGVLASDFEDAGRMELRIVINNGRGT